MNAFTQYLSEIRKNLSRSDATERTYYAALKALIDSVQPRVTATIEPKRSVECGAPDMVVSRTPGPVNIGHVECKDIGTPLDDVERSEQLKRYRHHLDNLLLTDYLEFRWYVGGELRRTARIARTGRAGKLIPEGAGEEALTELLQDFLSRAPQDIATPKELAERMARLTHMIRDIVAEAFEKDKASDLLRDLRHEFAKALIPDLDQPAKTGEFADMYAQTLAYGLFAARCNHSGPQPFRRLGAAAEIPKTNPFLRKLFEIITGPDLDDEPYVGFVNDVEQVLDHANIDEILKHFGKRTRRQDPVLHFYETFLATYDPETRERRGIYYTPEPVVSYIVRSVDHLLRTRFGLPQGLADTSTVEYDREASGKKPGKVKATGPRVLVLDPACGTATFLYAVVDLIREQFMRRRDAGMWSGYVKNHLLPRLFGFELLMAPYAVAHFKLGLQLAGHDLTPTQRKHWAYDFSGDERLGIYLTNTLEAVERQVETLFGPLRVITEEANAAAQIKRDLPILAVIGNPPYSSHSANRSWELKDGKPVPTFIGQLVREYYFVDGRPLQERNPKWLQDDYVKFLRWAQWRIERTGQGILAFITNHGYLDNPTFRGMRQHLMNSFTDIYILDLHGSSKKRQRAPDGGKDENVFDIQQGVAIGIFVKRPRTTGVPPVMHGQDATRGTGVPPVSHGPEAHATVHHAEVWGLRERKYEVLYESDLSSTGWLTLSPQSPNYLFVPQDVSLQEEYEKGWKVPDIFPVNSVGIVTARDHLVTDFDESALRTRVRDFLDPANTDDTVKQRYLRRADKLPLSAARAAVRADPHRDQAFIRCLYRPFDVRSLFCHDALIERSRREVMHHIMTGHNLGLVAPRRVEISGPWRHALVTSGVLEHVALSLKTIDTLFPLYLYPTADTERTGQKDLHEQSPWPPGEGGRVPNLNPDFIAEMEKCLGVKFDVRSTGVPPVGHGLEAHATDDALRVRQGAHLPHWTREGATYAVTFRLADSLPQAALQKLMEEREWASRRAQGQKASDSDGERRLRRLQSEKMEEYLDAGHGKSWLRKDAVAEVVADAVRFFDGNRYDLAAWCVMPNHVHVVVRPMGSNDLPEIVHSWKSFSAKRANRILKRTGKFWQTEYYEHLIRDEKDFRRRVEYVLTNPERVGLKEWKWRGGSLYGTGVPPAGHGLEAHATVGPEDVFHYIYAIFHSPTYRQRYAEFLKIDFPRVPLTSDRELFRRLCALGRELVGLHLLESPAASNLITRYPVPGDNVVEKGHPKYVAPGEPEPGTGKPLKHGRVYISKTQHFEGVPPEVWEFHVGGYQPMEKWLKDRRGRALSYEDLQHYQNIAVALKETIRLMAEIDGAIPSWALQ